MDLTIFRDYYFGYILFNSKLWLVFLNFFSFVCKFRFLVILNLFSFFVNKLLLLIVLIQKFLRLLILLNLFDISYNLWLLIFFLTWLDRDHLKLRLFAFFNLLSSIGLLTLTFFSNNFDHL